MMWGSGPPANTVNTGNDEEFPSLGGSAPRKPQSEGLTSVLVCCAMFYFILSCFQQRLHKYKVILCDGPIAPQQSCLFALFVFRLF